MAGARQRLAREDGFTLPEVLVVAALLAVVLGGLLSALETAARVAPRGFEYGAAVQEVGDGVSRIVRELRQADRVVATTPNSVTFDATYGSSALRVNIDCSVAAGAAPQDPSATVRRCVRVQAPQGAPLPPAGQGTVEVDRLLNGTAADPVFSFTPDPIAPTYVALTVRVPSGGSRGDGLRHPITITNGTLLPNTTLGG